VNDGIAARQAAISILSDVLRKRRPLDRALEHVTGLPSRDAGFARAIATETFRRLGQIQALVEAFVPKPPLPHRAGPVLEILYAGCCELLFLHVAPHASVDAANRLAQDDAKALHFKPLINAVLRRVSREGRAIVAAQDAARLNTPDWLWSRWCADLGEDTTRLIAMVHLHPAPVDVVLNGSVSPGGEILFGNVARLREGARIEDLPGFREGSWWVQDAAATLPVRLLGDVGGKNVIDLCAAPGGKTMQLAAAGGVVTAVEREPDRAVRLRQNLERTKLSATVIECDMRDYRPENRAPFVLLDTPCSATGTIRRHPELPWIKSASDVTLCEQAAGELLDQAATMVAPDGLLVVAVCSLEPEEGLDQVEAFLRRTPSFSRLRVDEADLFGHGEWITGAGDLRTLPCQLGSYGGMDGFYAARLRRAS